MKNKLLFSTALVAAAFAASDVLAQETGSLIINGQVSEQSLQDYANSDAAHQLWVDNVTTDGLETTVNSGYIQAKNLDIANKSNITVSGKGVFISGDTTTNVSADSTVTLENSGHLLSAYDTDHNNRAVNIEGSVAMNTGTIRAASSANGENYSSVIIGEGGKVTAEGNNNFIASRNTVVNGDISVANGASLDFVGDMIREENGFLNGGDTEKNGTLTISESGSLTSEGNVDANAVSIVNNGTIANNSTTKDSFNLGNYSSDGGNFNGGFTFDGSKVNPDGEGENGSVILANNATITTPNQNGADANDINTISISNAKEITLTNGSAIDASYLKIEGDADNKTQITIGGNNPDAGRGEGDDSWRNNSYILSYNEGSISNADITILDGGHIMQAATGDSAETAAAHDMSITDSTITVEKGGMMKSSKLSNTNSAFNLSNTQINLFGSIDGNIKDTGNSEITVSDADAYIRQIESLNKLNINADTTTQTLFGADSTVSEMNIAEGKTFTLDTPGKDGTAVKLTANTVNVDGTLVVGNGAASGTNYEIENTNVNDGGILNIAANENEYASNVTLNEGATMAIGVANKEGGGIINGSIASGNSLTVEGASKLAVVIADDVDLGEDGSALTLNTNITDKLKDKESGLTLADNFMYALSVDETSGTVTAAKEDASGIASNMTAAGASANAAGAAAAFALADGLTGQGQAIHDALSNSMQTGNASAAAKLAEDVAPSAAPVVQTVETGLLNQAYGAVSSQLSGGNVAAASEGKASGDGAFSKAAAWVRTLFNKTEIDDTSKAKGFDAETTGVALGFHKEVADNVKAGIAYAYGDTDIDGSGRDSDVESHTFMLYGEYKPSNWYVNGIASYGMSDYDEKKHTSVGTIDGSYDVETYGLQAMTGYEMNVGGYNLTPEAGLRYAHIKQDSYRDSAGQKISADDQDILTGIVGVKANKDFALESGTILRPEVRLAMTYDLMDGDNNAVVNVGGSSYRINGEELDPFGIEAGAGVTAELSDNWDVTAGYQGRFRSDYTDHTGLLSAKYKF